MLSPATLPLLLVLATAVRAVPISSANKLFGHAIKNGPLAPHTEQTAFEHVCGAPPCTITQVHVPSIYPQGGDPWDWEAGRLRFYVDNETTPSIDIFLRELASVGKRDAVGDTATIGAFGTPLFGKTAKSGGAYSTMRIPFGSSIKVTIQNADTATHGGIYWLIVRGIESLPVTLGGELTLPDQARLHVFRNTAVLLQPQDLITLVSAPAGTAGALVNVFLDNNSTDPNYLEACFRFTADGAANPTFLSSGTEDFFLSASYFDEGPFQNSQSGVTYAGGRGDFAMYKTHDSRDFVLWSDGALLQWRNNEHSSGPTACPTTWPWVPSNEDSVTPPLGTGPLTTDTLVFYYSWPSTGLTFSGKAL